MDFGTPEGIFGYSAVPDLEVEASPSEDRDDDASAYVIFFLNLEESPVIENPGHGLTYPAGEFADKVRVAGKVFVQHKITGFRRPMHLAIFHG